MDRGGLFKRSFVLSSVGERPRESRSAALWVGNEGLETGLLSKNVLMLVVQKRFLSQMDWDPAYSIYFNSKRLPMTFWYGIGLGITCHLTLLKYLFPRFPSRPCMSLEVELRREEEELYWWFDRLVGPWSFPSLYPTSQNHITYHCGASRRYLVHFHLQLPVEENQSSFLSTRHIMSLSHARTLPSNSCWIYIAEPLDMTAKDLPRDLAPKWP